MRRPLWPLIGLLVLTLPALAGKVRVRLPDTTAVTLSTVTVPVYVDSSLTGLNVTAFQLRIQYSATVLTLDSVLTQGAMTGAGGSLSYGTSGGAVTIAWAGSTPLQGTGPLVYLRFLAKQAGYSGLTIPDTVSTFFNENTGSPGVFIDNGWVSVQDPPAITISPSSAILAPGEVQQFSAYGGAAPYTWSVTDPGVASIASDGLLTALAAGTVRVIAQDTTGNADTSTGVVEVRALRLNVQNVSAYPRAEITVPVMATSLTGLGITAGRIVLTFNTAVLSPTGINVTGTLLEGYGSVSYDTSVAGRVTVAFAGAAPLSGSGLLLGFRLRVRETATYGSNLSITSSVFNETVLSKNVDGSMTVLSAGTPYVSPQTASLLAGDSLQFSVSSGLAPYQWSTTDSTIARIGPLGMLHALRSGVVKVVVKDSLGSEGMSGTITIYGASVTLPTRSAPRGQIIDVPLTLERLVIPGGGSVIAFSADIRYDTATLRFRGLTTTGTLTNGWSFAVDSTGNRIVVAGASATGFTTTGVILNLRIETRPTVSFGASGTLTFQSITLNEGDPSAQTTNGRIDIVAPPAPPVQYSPSDGQAGVTVQPTLAWYSSGGAERYRLQMSLDSLFGTVLVDDSTLTSTSRSVGPLSILTRHFWRVSASNGAGVSGWSAVWSFTTQGILPAQVVLAQPADSAVVVGDSVLVAWFASAPDVTSYDVQWSTNASFASPSTASGITDTSTTLPVLPSGTYWWRVRARNAHGAGPYSDPRRFVIPTQGILPAQVVLAQPADSAVVGGGSVMVVWFASAPDVTSYDVQWSTDPSFASPSTASGITDTSTALPVLPPGTYWWRVRAQNAQGAGPYSDPRRFVIATTGVTEDASHPEGFRVMQNYPNPFNPSTVIAYHLPSASRVTVSVFNALGQPVAVLFSGEQQGGWHQVEWRADAASGVYLYRVEARGQDQDGAGALHRSTGRMLLLK